MPPLRRYLPARLRRALGPLRRYVDRRTVAAYLEGNPAAKLHLGSGTYHQEGWLNADLEPVSPADILLDATRTFPFDGNRFAFIYSEHMIEHVSYADGRHMLAECLRVLRPGGVLRIATPRIGFLLDLFRSPRTPLQETYLHWATRTWAPEAPEPRPIFVLNTFVRAWGHRFIYDEETLAESMRNAGFQRVRVCDLGQSEHAELRNLEHEQRLPPGLLRLETMVMEGTKGV